MIHSCWLHNLLSLSRFRRDRRRQAAQNRPSIRLRLESLEERLTPAQTAGSYTDLVNAVAADTAANTSYVIDITQSFQFSPSGQVTISNLGSGSTLTIEGQNGTNYTLTGNNNRLFTTSNGEAVTFQDLTLTGGMVDTGLAGDGGGILDAGANVTLNRVTVKGNTVLANPARGGGISVTAGGNLTIEGGSTIQSNSVDGSDAEGGGIFVANFGHLTVEGGSTIQSNRAIGYNTQGGGVYVSGISTVNIVDSTFHNNVVQGGDGATGTAAGKDGGDGGRALGGGLYVTGSAWTVTLRGDTLSDNRALAGNGGKGAAGPDGHGVNTPGGNGTNGGNGGFAAGGAAYLSASSSGSCQLTVLDDLADPIGHPSTFFDNSVQGGNGGNGGAGGTSTGTANNTAGGNGGSALDAGGGAVYVGSTAVDGIIGVTIGNTTFYGNSVTAGNGGVGGAAGTGGSGTAGKDGTTQSGGNAFGGGLGLGGETVTLVNCTVAHNTVTGGLQGGTSTRGSAIGGGVSVSGSNTSTLTLDNSTLTQNTLNGTMNEGSGADITVGKLILLNNLILGNSSLGSSATDLDSSVVASSNASNNFITSVGGPNVIRSTSNILGNPQPQLGGVVGVSSGGKASGGPIYYPLLPGTVSVGAGTTSVLDTIAFVEEISTANATDEIGNLLSTNAARSGSLDLGAVQSVPTSPSSPPPSPPSSPLSLSQEILTIVLDVDALIYQNNSLALSILNSLSQQFLGHPLPPSKELIPDIETAFNEVIHLI